MKAKYPGTCGLCFKRFKVGDEIIKVHQQLLGPVSPPYAHKACADHVNRVLAPEVKSQILQDRSKNPNKEI